MSETTMQLDILTEIHKVRRKIYEINPGEEAGQQLGLGGGKLSWLNDYVDILEV